MRTIARFLWWGAVEGREVPVGTDGRPWYRVEVPVPTLTNIPPWRPTDEPIAPIIYTAIFDRQEWRAPDGYPIWIYLQRSGPVRQECVGRGALAQAEGRK